MIDLAIVSGRRRAPEADEALRRACELGLSAEIVQGTVTGHDARHVLLATGSTPLPLPGVRFDGERVLSPEDARHAMPPRAATVFGRDRDAIEIAWRWARTGTKVTLVAKEPLLPDADEELARAASRALVAAGVVLADEGELGDVSVVALGREPCTRDLGLEGLVRMQRGYVEVDARMRTNVPWLYAVGGVVPLRTDLVAEQIEIALASMTGRAFEPLDVEAKTVVTPELAWIGLTEADVRARGLHVHIERGGDDRSFKKTIADARTGVAVGVHLLGEGAEISCAGLC